MTTRPDIYTNVHKGIRRALFEACLALGRAAGPEDERAARALLGEALRFVRHHGENEDAILLPMIRPAAPEIAARMEAAHAGIEADLSALEEAARSDRPAHDLHLQATGFLATYLDHMREEEAALEAGIRAAVPAATLASFGAASVARTAPRDQRMMLGWMLPAMPRPEAEALLGVLPAGLAAELRQGMAAGR